MSQCKISWLGGRKLRRTSTVRTATRNEKNALFVLSVDGMLGREALVALDNLSQLMAAKMDEPILHVRGYINGQILIAVTR